MNQRYVYLSPEWVAEAHRRLREDLPPEKMKFVTSSMVTFYRNCPDGKDRAVFYRFVDGVCEQLTLAEGEPPQAEFRITGDYHTFARISRAEMGSRAALVTGKLKLQGNMAKALSLASSVDHMNRVLATIPTDY